MPDRTPLHIEYKASVNLPFGTEFTEENNFNKFTLYGSNQTKQNDQTISLSGTFKPDAGIVGTDGSLTINKIGITENNTTESLSGAKFEVNKVHYDATTELMVFDETYKSNLSTSTQGTVTVNDLKYDQYYEVRETSAPSGYIQMTILYMSYLKVTHTKI